MEIPSTIEQTQAGLLKKKFTAADLVDACLAEIKKRNEDLNVFITVTEEFAFKQAGKVDALVANNKEKAFRQYPLLGVTVAHKDLFLTKGIRTTAGSRVLEAYVPAYSATVVRKLEDAGCILVGKTNCDAWAHGASGENSDFGPTKNPWDAEYVPGGSSSGSAVAVSTGMSLISTGTDTGGSVRQPASFCGVVGLKPTYGAVSRYGVVAMASSLDSVGHFTKSVGDSRRVFGVTRGEDGHDGTVKSSKYVVSSIQNPVSSKKLKLGIPKEYFIQGIDREVADSVMAAAKVFEKQGMETVEVSLPHTKDAISVYYIIQPAEVSSNLGRYDGVRYGNPRAAFGAEAKRRIMLGTYVLSAGYYDAYYLKAMQVRSKIIADFDEAFSGVDVIIAPVSPTPAFKLGEKAGSPLKMYLADILTVGADLAGIPGLAIPSGFSRKGLPLGFQLMGPRFSEETLFALGELYEKVTKHDSRF